MANAQDVTKTMQMQYPRVRTAYEEKKDALLKKILLKNLKVEEVHILLVGFKQEKRLDVYITSKQKKKYELFTSYEFCTLSGTLGPKRKQGDLQVPEGFYSIDRFNPNSTYLLSLGINYPNSSDQILSDKKNPGGDIFIHGDCVSIGCIPITDEWIKELYILCVEAANNGQKKIPVYLFPCELTTTNLELLKRFYNSTPALLEFWKNLAEGYQEFLNSKQELVYSVNSVGKYIFTKR